MEGEDMVRMRFKLDVPTGFFIALYLGSFVVGVILVNLLWSAEILGKMTSVYTILGRYQDAEHATKEYFLFLLKKKSIFIGSSLMAGLAGIGEIFALLVVLWLGFLAGGLAAVFLLQTGVKGLFFCALGILLQILLYIPATIVFLLMISRQNRNKQRGVRMHKKELEISALICGLFIICCLAGVFLETYVNPFFWLRTVI